jgi:hypothetical protein
LTDETDQETIRAAMGILGRRTSAKKTASSRENLKKVIERNRANAKPCTCGRTDGSHAVKCPVWSRERMARYRANKKAKEAPPTAKGE